MKSLDGSKQCLNSKESGFESIANSIVKTESAFKSRSIVKILQEKIIKLNQSKFKIKRPVAIDIRDPLRMNKSPNRNGYDIFISDEDRRYNLYIYIVYLSIYTIRNMKKKLFFFACRGLDEYSSRNPALSSRTGIPYYY